MLDTVRLVCSLVPRTSELNFSHGWRPLRKKSPIRLFLRDHLIKCVEVELPKVLFGTNARLITKPQQIVEAMAKVQSEVAKVALGTLNGHFTRVDLVWHFRGNPAEFFAAHQHCRHPSIRGNTAVYSDSVGKFTDIRWPGSQLLIRMYAKETRLHGEVIRVECQLRGQVLSARLNGGKKLFNLDFHNCYSAFRNILLAFKPTGVPIGKARQAWLSALNTCPAELAMFLRESDPNTAKKCRREISQLRMRKKRIEWDKLLPAGAPPSPWPPPPVKVRIK